MKSAKIGNQWLVIDPATAGLSGTYLAEMERSTAYLQQKIFFVGNFYCPGANIWRLFYKYSELHAQPRYRLGRLRLLVRSLELVYALARIVVRTAIQRYKTVCYALSSNLLAEYAFLWVLKHLVRCKVIIICHDVIPFVGVGESLQSKSNTRARFYRLADFLLVHNSNSRSDLMKVFGVQPAKIYSVPFPVMDPWLLETRVRNKPSPKSSTETQFLFVGHLRQEKGIDVLISAWKIAQTQLSKSTLVIAGNRPRGVKIDVSELDRSRVTVITRYLSDDELLDLVDQCDCVILPYRRGTNSGIPGTVLVLERDLIVSDIPMFKNNTLIPPHAFFASENAEALAKRIVEYESEKLSGRIKQNPIYRGSIADYKKHYARQIYAMIIKIEEAREGDKCSQ